MGTVIGARGRERDQTNTTVINKKHIAWIADAFNDWIKLHQELHEFADKLFMHEI